jgi:endo-1,4-beta-xylanase
VDDEHAARAHATPARAGSISSIIAPNSSRSRRKSAAEQAGCARFVTAFDARAYKRFLNDVADRGLAVLITELDVLDDGLPAANGPRDRGVADAYKRYLDAALQVPAIGAAMTFGLSDRYTWLQEDFPREDGAPRRPLPFDDQLQPKLAYDALSTELGQAARRRQLWRTPRG